jgi:hypothetical protein
MLARVLLRRVVAAEGRAAFLTRAQMDPSSADLHTLSALTALSMLDRCNRGKMGAGFFRRHFTSLSKIHGRTEPTLHPQRSTLNRLHDQHEIASLKFTKTRRDKDYVEARSYPMAIFCGSDNEPINREGKTRG